MKRPPNIRAGVSLADRTTLGVGGPAAYFASCSGTADLQETLRWCREQDLELFVLGGGSNLLVADVGFPGVVVELLDESLHIEAPLHSEKQSDGWRIRAAAGLSWDRLVESTVERGLTGIEALSGIPGRVGAAPIQNIGAYGQEVATHLESVEYVDSHTGEQHFWTAPQCEFGYRTSAFKKVENRHLIVTGLTLRLPLGSPTLAYGELRHRFQNRGDSSPPTPAAVRDQVLDIRSSKSMVLRENDPNRRSAGSFFVNPVLLPEEAELTHQAVEQIRGAEAAAKMPRYPDRSGRIKLSAAWLIEAAGFHKGYCLGNAGLSTRHSLALINQGGASAAELIALAARIRHRVHDAFGVVLRPEPVFLGFPQSIDELLA